MEEYRARYELLDEKGRLTHPGRSARDVFLYNKENAAGKLSEWERYFVVGDRFVLEIDYGHTPNAGIAEVRLTDRETDEQFVFGGTRPFPGDAFDLDFSCGEEHTVKYEDGDFYLLLTSYDGVRRVRFRSSESEGDFSCADDSDGIYTAESPGGKRFYFRGFRCFPELAGYLRVHNIDYILDARTFFFSESVRAAMPSRLPYLRGFGSAAINGRVFGLSLSDGADGAGENALFTDGVLRRLERVYIKRTESDAVRPWYISDSERRLHLEFLPDREYRRRYRPALFRADVFQTLGTLSGTVELPDGEVITIDDMPFCCEEKR